jgi:hypothetical protein
MESELESHKLPGIPDSAYYIPNFITEAEEEYLISKVSLCGMTFGASQGKSTHHLHQVQTAPAPKWVSLKARRYVRYATSSKWYSAY